jgi:hypothetical protein
MDSSRVRHVSDQESKLVYNSYSFLWSISWCYNPNCGLVAANCNLVIFRVKDEYL